MPIAKIGSFSLRWRGALGPVLALLVASFFLNAQTSSDSASFERLAAQAGTAREAGRPEDAVRAYRAALELRPSWDEGWWYLGTILYDTDHFDEAIPALRRVVEMHPQAAPALAFLGLSEFETGDYRGAYSHLNSARELGFAEDPDVEKVALYHLALVLNLRGEFDQATDLLTTKFGTSHLSDQIKVAIGLAFLRVPILPSQLDPAKDALVHAAGDAAALIANHETEAASRSLEQMVRDYPETPYLHYQYGLLFSRQDARAEAELQKELQVTPGSALPRIALASIRLDRKDPEGALNFARQAVQIAPRSADAHQALSRSLRALNKNQEAEAASQRAQELAGEAAEVDGNQVARYSLNRATVATSVAGNDTGNAATRPAGNFDDLARTAESERRAGRLEQALDAYRGALAIRSGWAEGWRQVGTISYMQGRYADAVAALQQAVSVETKQPDTWTLLGLSEFEMKDYPNSLIHLERGRALGFSGNAAAVRISRYHLALLLNRNGEFDRALDVLIPEIAPGALADEIQFAMGIALLRIPVLPEQVKPEQEALVRTAGQAAVLLSDSHYEKGLPILQTLLRDYPTTPFLHYAYGDALAATSMYDEAQVQLREETRLNPGSALAYLRLAEIELTQHHSANALTDAQKAVAIVPESAEARYLLGRSYLEEGDVPAAIRELEAARQRAPNIPKIRFNLARAYAKAGRTAEAEQERGEFERLNALLPGQQKSYGDRAPRGGLEGVSSPRSEK